MSAATSFRLLQAVYWLGLGVWLGAIVMILVFWVEFRFEPPWWVHVLIWGPLTVGLAVFGAPETGVDWSIITAATVMTMAPLLVAFLLFQRQFVQSFMRAGIR